MDEKSEGETQKTEPQGSANAIVLDIGDRQPVVSLPQQRSITEQEAWAVWHMLQEAKRYQEQLLRTPKFRVSRRS